jgi:nucleotide-binding universal stress UspA family protein
MFSNIVVGTDGSETANAAVALAVELARQHDAVVHLVNAYKVPGGGSGVLQVGAVGIVDPGLHPAALEKASRTTLEQAAARIRDVKVATHAVAGPPAEAMISVATSIGADLIVVGSKGMRGARRMIGSVPNSVAHRAPCHVLVAKTT